MKKVLMAAAVLALPVFSMVLLPVSAQAADEAEALLRRAERAMGGTDLKTLRFTASGTGEREGVRPNLVPGRGSLQECGGALLPGTHQG